MSGELLFLMISLSGAFLIGSGTAYAFGIQRHRLITRDLQASHTKLVESMAELERTRSSLDNLKSQITDSVDLHDFKQLSERYADLEAAKIELEQRLTLGLGRKRRYDDSWAENPGLAEELGLSILGEVPPEESDDLTRVQGISLYLEERLNRIGIKTYEQLARLTEDQTRVINEAIEVLPGRIRREGWVEQCQRLFAEVRRY